jgi:hypothetical protein
VTDIKREWKWINANEYRCGPYLIRWTDDIDKWCVYWGRTASAGYADLLCGGFKDLGMVKRYLRQNWRRLEKEEPVVPYSEAHR